MLGFEDLLGSVRRKHLPSPPQSEEEKGGCGPSFQGWSSKPKQGIPLRGLPFRLSLCSHLWIGKYPKSMSKVFK